LQLSLTARRLVTCAFILYPLIMSKEGFRIISVTGAQSKVGKTTLCTVLLDNLDNFGAIKFTKTSLYTSVIDDPETIAQKDTDTARMSGAGAEKVVWVQGSGNDLEDALNISLGKMNGLAGVVVEGNSPVDFLKPHLVIFIIGQDGQIKPQAVGIIKRADIIVINSGDQTVQPPFPASMLKENAEVFVMDLAKRTGDINGFIASVRKKTAEGIHRS